MSSVTQFKNEEEMLTNEVTKKLQKVLSNTYSLYLATHNYHWNIEGPLFASLHEMFEEQYTELFEAIDEIAERIRSLGDYALPFEDANIMASLENVSHPLKETDDANKAAKMMVENLIALSQDTIDACQTAKVAAVKAEDDETEDLMIERIMTHQKTMWMLKSIIK